jgi:hypothetical protein
MALLTHKMVRLVRVLAAGAVAATCLALPAAAEGEVSLGKFESWEALTYDTPETKVCYVFSAPSKSEASKKATRSDIYFMVSHFPGKKVKGQPSTMVGYTLKEGADVTLAVGEKSFTLYPVGELAWTDKGETERAILAAMKGGKAMTVKGLSKRGTETTDTYSLAGFSAAMGKIDSACK